MARADRPGFRRSLAHALARRCGGRPFRRLKANKDGATAVEFGLIGPLFFVLMVAILETGLVQLASLQLNTATTEAARLILTGQAQNFTREQFKQALCANVTALIDCDNGVLIDVASSTSGVPSLPSPTDGAGNVTATGDNWDPGSAGSTVVVRALYQYPILARFLFPGVRFDLADLGNGKRLLVSTLAFTNEPYASASGGTGSP
jgi:Flp pilus assembly protein TadG